jgi:hypothetical protein
VFGLDPHGLAGDLGEGRHRRLPRVEDDGDARHALAPDGARLDGRAVLHRRHQREQAGQREVDIAYRLVRDDDVMAVAERDDLGAASERVEFRGGQQRQQPVLGEADLQVG